MDFCTRSFTPDLEIRSDVSGRTVRGIVAPFGQVARVSDGGRPYDEAFERSAFDSAVNSASRVKLLSQHQRASNPLGRATLLRADQAGLYGEFHVSRTAPGDEVLELVRDGALDSFSVGFAKREHVVRGGVTWRTAVDLHEVSVVTFPAYAGARIQRNDPDLDPVERMRLILGLA